MRIYDDVASDAESVLKIALNFVEDIFGGATENDRASFGLLALSEEREVFITNLVHLEKRAV